MAEIRRKPRIEFDRFAPQEAPWRLNVICPNGVYARNFASRIARKRLSARMAFTVDDDDPSFGVAHAWFRTLSDAVSFVHHPMISRSNG